MKKSTDYLVIAGVAVGAFLLGRKSGISGVAIKPKDESVVVKKPSSPWERRNGIKA